MQLSPCVTAASVVLLLVWLACVAGVTAAVGSFVLVTLTVAVRDGRPPTRLIVGVRA